MSLAIDLHRYRNLVGNKDGCFIGVVSCHMGCTIAQDVSHLFQPRWPGFDPNAGHVGCVADKVALWQAFSKYFGFPCQFSFHQQLHIHLSSYHQCHIALILTAWLNNRHKIIMSHVHFSVTTHLVIRLGWCYISYFKNNYGKAVWNVCISYHEDGSLLGCDAM
jgi:hypothetical protein